MDRDAPNRALRRHSKQGELIFGVIVTDGGGNVVSKTEYGRGLETVHPVEESSPRNLQQGASVSEHVILTNLFNMTKPGSYEVQVTWGPGNIPIASSNVLVITIANGPHGDLNGDGVVDVNDVKIVQAALNGSAIRDPMTRQVKDARDLNGDGVIDDKDVRALIALCTSSGCGPRP